LRSRFAFRFREAFLRRNFSGRAFRLWDAFEFREFWFREAFLRRYFSGRWAFRFRDAFFFR